VAVYRGEGTAETRIAEIEFVDQVRDDARTSLDQLRAQGYRLLIASGDHEEVALEVGRKLGFLPDEIHGACSPEGKVVLIQSLQDRGEPTLVVGDGANDAAALATARVGVAVHGSLEVAMAAADIYLPAPGVSPLVRLLSVAGRSRRTLLRNYAYSVAYNSVSATLALLGVIGPLFAAIIMPVSALTVFISSQLAFRRRGAA
jgi:P-type E1-E2 ATPase